MLQDVILTKYTNKFFYSLFLLFTICLLFSFGVVAGYDPLIGIILLSGVALLALVFFNTYAGIYLAMFFIPFDRLARLGTESYITIAKVVLLATIFVVLIKRLISKDDRLVQILYENPLGKLALLFIFISIVSLPVATAKLIFIGQLVRRVSISILYFLLVLVVTNKKHLKTILWIYLVANVFVALCGVYEMREGVPVLSFVGGTEELQVAGDDGQRIIGASGDADFHAVVMLLGASLSVYLIYITRSKLLKLMLAGFFLLFVFNIYGSGSRGALLGLIISIGIFYIFAKFRWKWIITLSSITIAILLFISVQVMFPAAPTERLSSDVKTKSILYRMGYTRMAMEMIRKHPIIGIGTGNFPDNYNRYLYTTAKVPKEVAWTHNSFLQIWLENGPLGLIIYTLIFIFALLNTKKVWQGNTNDELSAFAITLTGIVSGLGFFAVTSNVIENENYWIIFAFSTITYNLFLKEKAAANQLSPPPLSHESSLIPNNSGIMTNE